MNDTNQPTLRWIDLSKIREGLEPIVEAEPYEKNYFEIGGIRRDEVHIKKGKKRRQLKPLVQQNSVFEERYSGKKFIRAIKTGGFSYILPIKSVSAHCYLESGRFYNKEDDDGSEGRYEKVIVKIKRNTINGEGQLLSNPRIELLIAEYKGNVLIWRKDQSKGLGRLFYSDCDVGDALQTVDIVSDDLLSMIGYREDKPSTPKKAYRASRYSIIFQKPNTTS